jgi:phage/plasmid-associated DNA primase
MGIKMYSVTGDWFWFVRYIEPVHGNWRGSGEIKPARPLVFLVEKDGKGSRGKGKRKPAKYLSYPAGMPSTVGCLRVDLDTWQKIATRYGKEGDWRDWIKANRIDQGFWSWVLKNPDIPIIITEGAKKALSLLSAGYVGISISGVWNGMERQDGTQVLIECLPPFLSQGRDVFLAYDSDILEKESVRKALYRFGRVILDKHKQINLKVVEWEPGQGKGIDDFIALKGAKDLNTVIESARSFQDWRGGFEAFGVVFPSDFALYTYEGGEDGKPTKVRLDAVALAGQIIETTNGSLKFCREKQSLYVYEARFGVAGVWARLQDTDVDTEITEILNHADSGGFERHLTLAKATKHFILTNAQIQVPRLQPPSGKQLIPFKNGALNLETGELLPHSREHLLTYQLPYAYQPEATCEPILDWLKESLTGEDKKIQLLRAFLRAVVLNRTDFQKYLEIVGKAGSGKSTFQGLASSLIGSDYVATSDLHNLETNRFENYGFIDKRLLLLPDQKVFGEGVQVFKQITGNDPVRVECKNQQSNARVKLDLLIIMTSQESLKVPSRDSAAIDRRRILIQWNNTVSENNKRNLLEIKNGEPTGEFASLLPGFMNWVLAMSDEEMTHYMRTPNRAIPGLVQERLERKIQEDAVYGWLSERCYSDQESKVQIGVRNPTSLTRDKLSEMGFTQERETIRVYEGWDIQLYPNYLNYCDCTSRKPLKRDSWIKEAKLACEDLGWHVEWDNKGRIRLSHEKNDEGEGNTRSYVQGLGIKRKNT